MSEQLQKQTGTTYAPIVRYLQDFRQKSCEELRQQMDAEIEVLKKDYAHRINESLEKGRQTFDADRKRIHTTILAPARRDVEVVASKQMNEAVDRVIQKCHQRLQQVVNNNSFTELLEQLILEAANALNQFKEMKSVEPLNATLYCNPNDLQTCQNVIKKHQLNLVAEPSETVWGGIEILTSDGTHRIKNTLLSRAQKKEKNLRASALLKIKQLVPEDL